MKLENEIRQQSFSSDQQKAAMNILFTANIISSRYESALKPLEISLQQLNVLSILKGQSEHTANVNLIKERMIDRMPNVSRLVNRLMDKGLIEKARNNIDQRVVHVKLTPAGLKIAEKGRELFQEVLFEISSEDADKLNLLLELMRVNNLNS
jgi:MarR family transcriptional regulator, organic hydroperoxide resistance regulator